MSRRRCLVIGLALSLGGCGDHSMSQQKRYDTYAPAALFSENTEAQPIPAGTVAQGDQRLTQQTREPPPVDDKLLARGRERYEIYCSPCHGTTGDGQGMIVKRGFPPPPSYHTARLRAASAQHIFDVITDGYGVMYSYAARVDPRDRWAIVAYIRALQQSQHSKLAEVPQLRSKLP